MPPLLTWSGLLLFKSEIPRLVAAEPAFSLYRWSLAAERDRHLSHVPQSGWFQQGWDSFLPLCSVHKIPFLSAFKPLFICSLDSSASGTVVAPATPSLPKSRDCPAGGEESLTGAENVAALVRGPGPGSRSQCAEHWSFMSSVTCGDVVCIDLRLFQVDAEGSVLASRCQFFRASLHS